MTARLLVQCHDYNGNKDVLFMMKPDDDRLPGGSWNTGNYTPLGRGEYHAKRGGEAAGVALAPGQIGLLRAHGGDYAVYADWSLRKVEAVAA